MIQKNLGGDQTNIKLSCSNPNFLKIVEILILNDGQDAVNTAQWLSCDKSPFEAIICGPAAPKS